MMNDLCRKKSHYFSEECTYRLFKIYVKYELEVAKSGCYRHTLAKFRTSSHILEIGRSRYINTGVRKLLYACDEKYVSWKGKVQRLWSI